MTKEDYVRFKNNGQLDDIAFYYFKENRFAHEVDMEVEQFKTTLAAFLNKFNGHAIQTPSGVKRINGEDIKVKILTYFDEKFK